MNVAPINTFVILLTLSLWVVSTNAIASESVAPRTEESAPIASETSESASASDEGGESTGAGTAAAAESTEGEAATAATAAEGETQEEKPAAPIMGAFGLTLGERFSPYMVTKVISQEEHNYKGRDKAETTGSLYRIEPKVTNRYFDKYLVKTTSDGRIYWIQGDFEHPEKQNQCKQSENVAKLLVGKYGLPRARGRLGEWYAFREVRKGPYKGIRLYAPRCRNGRYSIRYADDEVRLSEPVPESEVEATDLSGL